MPPAGPVSTSIRLALLPLLVSAATIEAEVVTLSPVADTTLFQTAPTNNLGAVTTLIAGATANRSTNRALIKFDLAANVPSDAIIRSVTLTLVVVTANPFGAVDSTFDLHRVLQDWGEGNKSPQQGAPATADEATWLARFHPVTLWATPGGAAGTDYTATVSAAKFISGTNRYTFDSTPGMIADVQLWLTNLVRNFGWILISQAEGTPQTSRRFGSRENSTNAPALVVEYTVPPRMDLQPQITGGQFQFSFTAQAGESYTLEFRDSLSSGSWLTLTNIAAPLVTTNVIVSDPLSGVSRFYRVATP